MVALSVSITCRTQTRGQRGSRGSNERFQCARGQQPVHCHQDRTCAQQRATASGSRRTWCPAPTVTAQEVTSSKEVAGLGTAWELQALSMVLAYSQWVGGWAGCGVGVKRDGEVHAARSAACVLGMRRGRHASSGQHTAYKDSVSRHPQKEQRPQPAPTTGTAWCAPAQRTAGCWRCC